MRSRLSPILHHHASSMAAARVLSRVLAPPALISSKLSLVPSSISQCHCPLSSSSSPLFRGLFSAAVGGGGDWRSSRWLGGKVLASQRGYRRVRGRPAARKKQKELELDVKICIEEQLPDDSEILD